MIYTPLAWLFRCSGLSPSGTHWDKPICLANICVAVLLAVFGIASIPREEDSTMYTIVVACYVLASLGHIGLIILNFLYRRSYQTILSDLRTAEEDLRRIDASPRLTAHQQPLILCTFVCLIVSMAVCQAVEGMPMIEILTYASCNVTLNIGYIQHLVLVLLLHSQFSALNVQLERFSAAADDTPVHVMSSNLQSVFRLHTHLHKTVADINGHLFIYNLTQISDKVIFCLTFMYRYLLSISDKTVHTAPSHNLMFIIQMLIFVVQCDFCHACAKEANRTVLLAHYTLQPHTPHRLWQEVGDFSYLCIGNKVHFTVGEIFTLERPLITKVAVLAFSYLVVAVQLKDVQLSGEDMRQPDANATNLSSSMLP